MTATRPTARTPEQLGEFFVARANAGDAEGLAALYEPRAVLRMPDGSTAAGTDRILAAYRRMLAAAPRFTPGTANPTVRLGNLALTSTRLVDGSVTAEVARRQPDGSWRWVLDNARIDRPADPDRT